MTTAAAVLLVSSSLWLGLAGPAFAHAIVKSTDPAIDAVVSGSPERVVMRFNEPVELSFGAIRVFDTDGHRVDAADASHIAGEPEAVQVPLGPELAQGTYTVTWRVVSADGHPISEAFVFHVGEPGENPQGIADQVLDAGSGSGRVAGALFGVARWINFAGLVVLGGAVAFLVIVWRHRQVAGARSPLASQRFSDRFGRLAVVSWAAVVVATVGGFVLQGAVAGGLQLSEALSLGVLGEVAETRYGRVAIAKLGMLAAAALLWVAGGRNLAAAGASSFGAATAESGRAPWIVVASAAVVMGLLATPGMSGHAGTTDPVALNLAADTVHLAAAAVWLGGLAVLVYAAFGATKGLTGSEAATTMAPVVARFSDVAVIAVAVVVATGVYRAWFEVGALRALTDATYGWVLLAKLSGFVPLIALGAINNRVTKPRIQRAVAAGAPDSAPIKTLRRLVTAEIALGVVVLAITALLVNLPPAKVEAGIVGPFITDVRLGSYNLNVLVDPNEVGENEVHLTATTPEGAPAPIKETKVLFRMPSQGIGPLVGRGVELAPGHFVVQGRHLSVSGDWQLEVVARISRFEEERAEVEVTVN